MTPKLKILNRKFKREYFENRKSVKWKKLKNRFKKQKRNSVRNFYSNFVSEMKETNPSKWYSLAKRLGADESDEFGLKVDCLDGITDAEAAEKIALHFSSISQEFEPLNRTKLPSYLPNQETPVVNESTVAKKLLK